MPIQLFTQKRNWRWNCSTINHKLNAWLVVVEQTTKKLTHDVLYVEMILLWVDCSMCVCVSFCFEKYLELVYMQYTIHTYVETCTRSTTYVREATYTLDVTNGKMEWINQWVSVRANEWKAKRNKLSERVRKRVVRAKCCYYFKMCNFFKPVLFTAPNYIVSDFSKIVQHVLRV